MNAADDQRKDVLPLVGYQFPEIDFEEALGILEAKAYDHFWGCVPIAGEVGRRGRQGFRESALRQLATSVQLQAEFP
jgi:hypothetical protein